MPVINSLDSAIGQYGLEVSKQIRALRPDVRSSLIVDLKAPIISVDFPFHINGDMSQRMMSILGEMAPGQEIYSIDESFLDATGIASYMPLEEFGHQMRNRVSKETGLTIGVGFGPTKTLAKLANHAAKKWSKTNGVVDLSSPVRQRKLMALIDISEVWGVGGRIRKRLEAMGINNVLELASCNTNLI